VTAWLMNTYGGYTHNQSRSEAGSAGDPLPRVVARPVSMEYLSQSQRFPWRLFWLLFAIGIIGILAIIPIAIDLFGSVVQTAPAPPIALPLLILIGVVQNLCMLALI
jgi:hypothetical protein